MITIYKNINDVTHPHYIDVEKALERIKIGKSQVLVDRIRKSEDKNEKTELKKQLPSVCFSGKFTKRTDADLQKHSGYIVLDFDNVFDIHEKKKSIFEKPYIQASWISPSGNGVKALVKIADTSKHREHFQALQDIFPEIDRSGINVSRVCYESYDKDILIKEAVQFAELKEIETVKERVILEDDDKFQRILKWINKTGGFHSGERNLYIFRLASACCRFGITDNNCLSLIYQNVTNGETDFKKSEIYQTVRSAYKANNFNSAEFDNEELVDRETRSKVEISDTVFDTRIKPSDVITGADAREDALKLYLNGYESVESTGITEVDTYFKFKKGEITLLTGIGNYGKSTWMKYLLLFQIIKYNKKIAIFSPEEAPAHEFFNDFIEMYFGRSIFGEGRPTIMQYEAIYDKLTKNIFFIYPEKLSPTPEYVKEKFLELIIKEKVEFCIIDPFNQMTNDYGNTGRSDKYLEVLLSDFSRFAKDNNINFIIIAHPTKMVKGKDGNYPCPDVFDIADGAMWNNKMDNILVYHIPLRQTEIDTTACEFHSKKIRRKKIVGITGCLDIEYIPRKRRYLINGKDPLAELINEPIEEIKIEYEDGKYYDCTGAEMPF